MFKEFKTFVMRGNVVDLAVGVIIGAAFGKIVSSLVNDILMPPIGMLVGGIDFSDLVLNLKSPMGSAKPVAIHYGIFINNVIDFFIVAFCVFLVVKGVNALHKQPVPTEPSEKKCPQCAMPVPIEAKRCGHCTSTLLILMLIVVALTSPARAQEPNPPSRPWTDKAEVSLVSTNGNSKGTTTSIKNFYAYHWSDVTGLELTAAGLGSKSGDQVTAENYNASEKVMWKLVGKNYVFERFGWLKDRFAGIRNRYDSSAGLGRLLIDLPNDKLNGELGGGYINEERTEAPRNDYGSGRAYGKYTHAITASSSFTQDGEFINNFKNSKGYLLNTETALIAALSTHLSLKAAFDWKRNGEPPPGFVKDDTITSMALVVNY